MRILITFTFAFASVFSFGQHTFFKLYTDGGDDYANGVVELKDSTFAITGNSSSFWAGQGQAFILKIDAEGNYVWSNHYGGSESDGGEKIMYKEDDGFYVAGYTNSFGNGGFDFYLFKTDLDGNLLWEKTYGGAGWERVHDAYLTRDGGVLMIGETSSNPTFDTDMWFVKTDANGDTLWTKSMGVPEGQDVAKTMYPISDSSFVVMAEHYVVDSSMVKTMAFELFDYGETGWLIDSCGLRGNTYPEDVFAMDGGFYAVGYTDNATDSIELAYYYKFFLGDQSIQSYASPVGSGLWQGRSVTRNHDSTAIYVGYDYNIFSSPDYETDAMFSKFSTNMVFLNTLQPIAFYDEDKIKETIPTMDGGTLTVGSSDGDINIGDKHSFAMKTLPNDSVPGWTTLPDVTQLVNVKEVNQLKEHSSIYPNPVDEELTIEVGFTGEYNYSIVDLNGRSVIESKASGTTLLSVSELNSGIYFVRLEQNGFDAEFKLIVR